MVRAVKKSEDDRFQARVTRAPIAHETKRGQEVAARFAGLAPDVVDVVAGAAGCSPYLASLLEKHADWVASVFETVPEDALEEILSFAGAAEGNALGPRLRHAKDRVALLVALADLGGVWDLEAVTKALTRFADLAVMRALHTEVAAEIGRGKIPGTAVEDAADAAGMVVLAMGKMGAGELNYSSDIDLICLFDEGRFDPEDWGDARAGFVRVTRRMAAMLSDKRAEGYVFRTDLRLRPDPAVTPVCMAMAAAERYYESLGRTWERAAHIKARAVAGDVKAGADYLGRLGPFVWRKHLDFAAIRDARDMARRIRVHKGLGGRITLPGHDLKLGRGGIREIEFFAQTGQLIFGGRDPDLRLRGTVEALHALARKGRIEEATADTLSADYRALREIEHRLQMIGDAQTHSLPTSDEGLERLANFMGEGDLSAWSKTLFERLTRVHDLTEDFLAPSERRAGGELTQAQRDVVARWRSYPALRSARAVDSFERMQGDLLARLGASARPDEALLVFDGFLAGLPAGAQLFALFEANPQLVDLIVDIAATAPGLARYLSHNAAVFDAVIAGEFFSDWPGSDGLTASLDLVLANAGDYETQLVAARSWFKEWRFRVGVHLLRGLIEAETAGAQYADLAEAVLRSVFPVVEAEFSRKHGPPPGRGAVVMGMGSLGVGRLNSTSDLDLIVIYDADGAEGSEGPRPLLSRVYFARQTQALVTALTAPMAEGKLFEVDMRLRPSGRQGPVATSLDSFQSYQKTKAWTWEHLALTRARQVAGSNELGQDVETFRRSLLAERRDRDKILADVESMRARLAQEKPAKGQWEAKLGAGRMQDIELVAQAAALMAGSPVRPVPEQIEKAESIRWLSASEVTRLAATYADFARLNAVARLLTEKPLDPAEIGAGGQAFLLRSFGEPALEALRQRLDQGAEKAAKIIATALARRDREGKIHGSG